MTAEEFYRTQWTYPDKMDDYYKCGIRFSYNDMIKFATDYAETKVKNLAQTDVVRSACQHDWNGSGIGNWKCNKCGATG